MYYTITATRWHLMEIERLFKKIRERGTYWRRVLNGKTGAYQREYDWYIDVVSYLVGYLLP